MNDLTDMVRADLRTEAEDEYAWLRRTAAAAQGVLDDYAAAQAQDTPSAGIVTRTPAAAAPECCEVCCDEFPHELLTRYGRDVHCPDCLSAAREHDAVLEDAQREYGSAGGYGRRHGPLDGCEP